LAIKQIPKSLLIHNVGYLEYIADDWNKNQYAPRVEVNNVRIDYLTDMQIASIAENKRYRATMFYDSVNSSPLDLKFKEKSKIVLDDPNANEGAITFYIVGIKYLYTDSIKVHHLEVMLA